MRKGMLVFSLPIIGSALVLSLTLQTFALAKRLSRIGPSECSRLRGRRIWRPGGAIAGTDVASKKHEQRVVVGNRTGANGIDRRRGGGAWSGRMAATCSSATTGNMTIVTELPGAQLPISPATDLIGIGRLLRSTFSLVVG